MKFDHVPSLPKTPFWRRDLSVPFLERKAEDHVEGE
jgi:hypothetical protein